VKAKVMGALHKELLTTFSGIPTSTGAIVATYGHPAYG
jgi:hypothetical protein